MATERDYYEILGVSKSATPDEIKKAYRALALEWHPDRNKAANASDKFKEINEAYAVLSDTQKKSAYDQFGHAAFKQNGSGTGGGNPFGGSWNQGPFTYTYSSGGMPEGFADVDPFSIFEQFFGGGFSGRSNRPRRNVYEISIDFTEAVKGATKEIHIPRGGAGEGSVKKTIKIPPGVDSGSRIRFDDFDIVLDVAKSRDYSREGDDLVTEKRISYTEAALGAVVEVPTIDGPVKIRVQPGTQPGSLVRLRGKGVPHVRGGGRGDEYVKLTIHVPEHVSKRQKELLEELAKEMR